MQFLSESLILDLYQGMDFQVEFLIHVLHLHCHFQPLMVSQIHLDMQEILHMSQEIPY